MMPSITFGKSGSCRDLSLASLMLWKKGGTSGKRLYASAELKRERRLGTSFSGKEEEAGMKGEKVDWIT